MLSKSSSKREDNSDKHLHYKKKQNKTQSTFVLQGTRKRISSKSEGINKDQSRNKWNRDYKDNRKDQWNQELVF